MRAEIEDPPRRLANPSSDGGGGSTTPTQPTRGWTFFERGLRAVAYALVFGVVALGLLGFAGLRTREVTGSGEGLDVTVGYAQITRPGLSTPFQIGIDSTRGPLPAEIEVEVPTAYLAMFDENGIDPEPDSIASDGVTETWTFRTDGETALHIDFDARLQPNVHSGQTGTVRVSGQGVTPVEVEFRTWVLP